MIVVDQNHRSISSVQQPDSYARQKRPIKQNQRIAQCDNPWDGAVRIGDRGGFLSPLFEYFAHKNACKATRPAPVVDKKLLTLTIVVLLTFLGVDIKATISVLEAVAMFITDTPSDS